MALGDEAVEGLVVNWLLRGQIRFSNRCQRGYEREEVRDRRGMVSLKRQRAEDWHKRELNFTFKVVWAMV